MSKSKYPNELDTSIEIPAVRDSSLSNSINGLRSAVFQIERVLGINPQGSSGNTVASRLNKVIDNDGNLKKTALINVGLLSGPISNHDVAENAGISEKKLNLDYSTQLLHSEIARIEKELNLITGQISTLISKISSHLSPDVSRSHTAKSVVLNSKPQTESDLSTNFLEAPHVQQALEDIYNKHINYSGNNIDEFNNSHSARQIYFDNSNVSGTVAATNVQQAIEAFITAGVDENSVHQDTQHSNGVLRFGKLRTVGNDKISEILISNISVSFSSSNGNSSGTTNIIINDEVPLHNIALKPFDIVQIVDNFSPEIAGEYELKSFRELNGNLISVEIFGLLTANSTVNTVINLARNIESQTNEAALLVTAIEESGTSSSRFLQIANPDCTRIISKGINPFKINSSNRYISLKIDNVEYNLDLYTPGLSRQTLDSIITAINKQLTTRAASAKAYRLDRENGGSELVIAHDIPDDDLESHSLTISKGSDNALDALGFSYIENQKQNALFGTKYFLNGQTYSGLKEKLDTNELVFFSNSNNIGIGLSSINFIDLGIKIGDIIIITNAQDSADNGSYLIEQVSDFQIRINSNQLPLGFVGNSTTNTRFRIFSNSISSQGITFDKVSNSFGSALLDIFMDRHRNIHYNKILEYRSEIVSSTSLLEIVDVDGEDFYNQTLNLRVMESLESSNSFYLSLDNSEPIQVHGQHNYLWITSGDKNLKLKIFVPDASAMAGRLSMDNSEINIPVYLFEKTNPESNMLLSRILFNNFNGRFSGGINGSRSFSKLPFGTISSKDLGSDVKERLLERPIAETRSNGVIYGFEIENAVINEDNFYTFDIKRGLGYVKGKRIEKNSSITFSTDINALTHNKVYVILNENGNFQVDTPISLSEKCITPYDGSNFIILGSIEFDEVNINVVDLRLFIDQIDLKLLNSITVSPQSGMGHFNDPVKALKYAKRFSELFPRAGIPSIHFKSGKHLINLDIEYNQSSATWDANSSSTLQIFYDKQIESGIFIDFPVVLQGEGSSTIIESTYNAIFTDTVYQNINFPISIVGSGFSAASRGHLKLSDNGFVEIKNLTLRNSSISIIDFNLKEDNNDLSCEVKIDNVYFDFKEFSGTFTNGTNGPRAIEIREISDTTHNKGSVLINDCTFLESGIHTDSPLRTKNLTISNNTVINSENVNFLFQDLYSFATATSGSNINLTNNRSNPTVGTGSAPELVASLNLGWGERFDRDIRVGGVSYLNEVEIGSAIKSDIIEFPVTKTSSTVFTWDMYRSVNGQFFGGGNANLSEATFSVVDKNGRWLVCNIGSGNDHGFMRFSAPVGARVKRIDLGVGDGGHDWSIAIHTQRLDNLISLGALNYGPVTSVPFGPADLARFDVNFFISSNALYTLEIRHNHPFALPHFYTKIYYEFTTLNAALGVES